MEHELKTLGLATLRELETPRGILASGKDELYGCLFGRDSLITALKLLSAYQKSADPYLLSLVEKILVNVALLQGTKHNLESGEEPGKIIHEYREDNHEHLTKKGDRPWYLYPDRTMRSYDSVDSTPLFLIAVARYYSVAAHDTLDERLTSSVDTALTWLLHSLAHDPRGFLTYRLPSERIHGGLATQSWMDSRESLFHEDGSPTPYPIAPLEAQAYAYRALRLWGRNDEASRLKERFNEDFIVTTEASLTVAFALDGNGMPLTALRSSIGHLLWASEGQDAVIDEGYVPHLVELLLSPQLFEPNAGIRTLSTASSHFDPYSYHNGSIWPHDTAIAAEGLRLWGYDDEALRVHRALLSSWSHFKTPIELFSYTDQGFADYVSTGGHRACVKQAWSAASMVAEL